MKDLKTMRRGVLTLTPIGRTGSLWRLEDHTTGRTKSFSNDDLADLYEMLRPHFETPTETGPSYPDRDF